MSADRFIELAPLAALGALDGEDRAGFEQHAAGCPACRDEVASHRAVIAGLAADLQPVPPSPGLRRRVLEAATGAVRPSVVPVRPSAAGAAAGRWRRARPALAAAVVIGLAAAAAAWASARAQRDVARAELDRVREATARLESDNRALRGELAALEARLAEAQSVTLLLSRPEVRLAALTSLETAPGAHARAVWNPATGEAMLVVSGLPPAPAGRAYEVWVIAGGPPAPAGLFHSEAEAPAVIVRLPRLGQTTRVRTFAVTVEPEGGTLAPTGPMVLAGDVV